MAEENSSGSDTMLPAIINGAGSLVGGLVSGIGSLLGTKKANDTNIQLARMANQWNIEQWERNNAYNAPAAQMERFQAAGLNPNLIYGQQNTANSIPAAQRAEVQAYPGVDLGIDAGVNDFIQTKMAMTMQNELRRNYEADRQLKETQTDAMKAAAALNVAKEVGLRLDNEKKQRLMETSVQAAQEALEQSRLRTGLYSQQQVLNNIRAGLMTQQQALADRRMVIEEEKLKLMRIKVSLEAQRTASNSKYIDGQIDHIDAQIRLLNANAQREEDFNSIGGKATGTLVNAGVQLLKAFLK